MTSLSLLDGRTVVLFPTISGFFLLFPLKGDDARSRDYVISEGAMKSVLQLTRGSNSLRILRITSWILQNFTRTKVPPLELNVVQEILQVLCELLDNRDDEVCL